MSLPKQSLYLSKVTAAYIAGFLDGDGCINAQIVKRSDYRLKFQIRVTVTFYQKTSRKLFLVYLHKLLGLGVIRHRKSQMTDYTITGFKNVLIILKEIYPFLVLKKKQAWYIFKIQNIYDSNTFISTTLFIKICKIVDRFIILNDSKKRTNTSLTVINILNKK
jgi:hypothetical protein